MQCLRLDGTRVITEGWWEFTKGGLLVFAHIARYMVLHLKKKNKTKQNKTKKKKKKTKQNKTKQNKTKQKQRDCSFQDE